MDAFLLENERLDDLQLNNLKLIQNTKGFCFGVDAVFLSDFAAEGMTMGDKSIIDLCTGNGVIPVLLSAKTKAERICGVEIQPEVASLAQRNAEYNGLTDKIEIICGNLKDAPSVFGHASFDALTCNPPYMAVGGGLINPADTKAVARHEISCNLEDIIICAKKLLRFGGRMFMVHRPSRLADIICCMRTHGIEPKRMKFVYPARDKNANLVLIEGMLGGKTQITAEPGIVACE